MTRLEVRGRVNGARCSGQAWMDHEFGSSQLRENQQGWDWFSDPARQRRGADALHDPPQRRHARRDVVRIADHAATAT